MLTQTFAVGGNGWVYLEQLFEGRWVIYEISIDNRESQDTERAFITIRRQPEDTGQAIILSSGSAGNVDSLHWSGRLPMQGSWIIRAGLARYIFYGNTATMKIIAEKLEDL
jgi:hypothetical protein